MYPFDPNPKQRDDVFARGPGARRAAPKPKPAEAEPEAASEPAAPPPAPAPEKPKVVLTGLKWAKPKGVFNSAMGVSLEAAVPAELKNITKVALKVTAKLPDGTTEDVAKAEVHLKDGKAAKEVTLYYPDWRDADGKLLEECKLVFTAKHRDSEEATSGELTVRRFATKVRFEREEGWVGQKVKVLADTDLEDGTEVSLTVALGEKDAKTVLQAKVKAAGGKLSHEWSPCLCGLKVEKSGKLPESVNAKAELVHGKEKAQAAKAYKLKPVPEAEWEDFAKDYGWNGYSVHSAFKQRLEGLTSEVVVKEKVVKAWGGYWINMSRAGIAGTAGGNPWDGYRWGRVQGKGMVPNRWHDGTGWKKMPDGFTPADGEYSAVGFEKDGDKFTLVNNGAEWPEKFKDYEYDKYKDKRKKWIKDSHTRWSGKFRLRPEGCPKKATESGCGYDLDLVLELDKVDKADAHTIALCPGAWRSNAGIFFYGESRIAMAAHEVGHLVGMPDEYAGGATTTAVPDGDGLVSGIDADSLMGANLSKVKKRHYANFAGMAETLWKKKSAQDLKFAAAKK